MAIEYVNGVPYEYSRYFGHTVSFPEDWTGGLTELHLAEQVGENKVREVKMEKLPACIRKLYIPAGIQRITLNREAGDGIEEIEVDAGNENYKTDGHALYSADGKKLIRLVDQHVETYAVAEGTEWVDRGAFLCCKNLHKIMIPAGVKMLGNVFSLAGGFAEGCSALEEVVISPDNPYMKSDGKAIYTGDGKKLICVACDGLGDYTVAEGTERMAEDALGGRAGLNRVILPASLQGTESPVRSGDFRLRCDIWKESLQFVVSENNPHIRYEKNAFYSADGKILLQAVRDAEYYEVRRATEIIASEAFAFVPSLKKLLLPEGIKIIGEKAFWNCESLVMVSCQPDVEGKRFVFPSSLEEIGKKAFSRGNTDRSAWNIEEIWMGENVHNIGDHAFAGFKVGKFTSLGCPEIGAHVFGSGDAIKETVDTMLMPAINPSKIKKPIQEMAVLGYCKEALAGNVLCEAGQKTYQAHLKRNKRRYVESVMSNTEVVRYMMVCGLIEDTDIDGMIEQVDGRKDAALKAELIEYAKRFALDGFDREMKKMDQEAEKTERKQKKALAKAEYEALPLSERAGMKYKLNPQEKVELLEEAVLSGTLEDLQNVCKVHGPFEFTARALGMAVRCRTADFTQELLKNGATFAYEASAAFTRKYNCVVKVTNKYSYNVNFALLALEGVVKVTDRYSYDGHVTLFALEKQIDCLKDMDVMPAEERGRSIAWICRAGICAPELQNLLYHAIMQQEASVVDALMSNGIDHLDMKAVQGGATVFSASFSSMDAAHAAERFEFIRALPFQDEEKLYWTLRALLAAGKEQKISFSGPELDIQLQHLCREKVFALAMEGKLDLSAAKLAEQMKACMRAGNISGLQYALDQGWATDKKALLKTAKRIGIEDAAMLEWLNLPS